MKYRIEISAENAVELAELLTKLAAHVIRDGATCGAIKILGDDGNIAASLMVDEQREQRH
jgi:hypothetical protein